MAPTTSDLSILDVIALFLRHKIWVIALTVVGATAGVVIGFVQEPVYRADTLLVAAGKSESRSGVAELAKQVGGLAGALNLDTSGTDKTVALAILRSRAFLVKFIRERGIDKVIFAKRLAPDGETWAPDLGGAPTDNESFEFFSKSIFSIREDNKTGLISVAMEWYDSDVAASWANEIVREVNTQLRSRARTRGRNSIKYLESEISRTGNVETQQAIFNLIERQINEIMLANVTEEYAFEVIDPAVPSDPDDYVKPRKVFLLASGMFAGFLLAIVLIVGRELAKSLRAPNSS